MEQGSIGEDAIKVPSGQLKSEEILLPNLAAGFGARHGNEAGRTVQTNGGVAEFGQALKVASWSATKIENREWRLAFDVAQ